MTTDEGNFAREAEEAHLHGHDLDQPDQRRTFHLPDDETLQVTVTSEGVIIDAFDATGELVGTVGMTADEWYEFAYRGGGA